MSDCYFDCYFCKSKMRPAKPLVEGSNKLACGRCLHWMRDDIGADIIAGLENDNLIGLTEENAFEFYLKSPLELLAEEA